MTNNNGNKLIDDAKNIDLKFNNNIKKLFGDQVNKVNKNNVIYF